MQLGLGRSWLTDCSQRGTRYCWAWGQHSFKTNKWTMFLETEASFPYCNWSTKMAGIIWLGSTSVQHVNNWQRLSRLPFLSLCKSRKFLETKTYYFINIKKKVICKIKNSKIFGATMVCISICRKLSSILLPFALGRSQG